MIISGTGGEISLRGTSFSKNVAHNEQRNKHTASSYAKTQNPFPHGIPISRSNLHSGHKPVPPNKKADPGSISGDGSETIWVTA